jgi:hypothetical protein
MRNITGFVLVFESSKTVQYSRRHHSKFHPKTVCSFCCSSTVSLTCFPASLPVTTVHRFHPNQSHSNQGTPLLVNYVMYTHRSAQFGLHHRPKLLPAAVLFQLQLSHSSVNLCAHFTLYASRLVSITEQQHTVTTSDPCPARPEFKPWLAQD